MTEAHKAACDDAAREAIRQHYGWPANDRTCAALAVTARDLAAQKSPDLAAKPVIFSVVSHSLTRGPKLRYTWMLGDVGTVSDEVWV